MDAGRVILLNGTSSVGKTSIARALQAVLPNPTVYLSFDTFLLSLPPGLQHRSGGVSFGENAAGTVINVGPEAMVLFTAWHRGLAGIVHAGADVVLDEAIVGGEIVRSYVEALAGLETWMIGVVCDPDVLVLREKERGNRALGLALGLASIVHEHLHYDFVVDTTVMDPETAANEVLQAVSPPNTPHAFRTLAGTDARP